MSKRKQRPRRELPSELFIENRQVGDYLYTAEPWKGCIHSWRISAKMQDSENRYEKGRMVYLLVPAKENGWAYHEYQSYYEIMLRQGQLKPTGLSENVAYAFRTPEHWTPYILEVRVEDFGKSSCTVSGTYDTKKGCRFFVGFEDAKRSLEAVLIRKMRHAKGVIKKQQRLLKRYETEYAYMMGRGYERNSTEELEILRWPVKETEMDIMMQDILYPGLRRERKVTDGTNQQ